MTLSHFTQADTLIPNPANPLDWNRYAYVRYNPLRYVDPSGHVCSDPEDPTQSCDGSGNKAFTVSKKKAIPGNAIVTQPQFIVDPENSTLFGDPSNACFSTGGYVSTGSFVTGYCAVRGQMVTDHLNVVSAAEGESIEGSKYSIASPGGASVSVIYQAGYDILLYENMMILSLNEIYWFQGVTLPLMDKETAGGSIMIIETSNGNRRKEFLGQFTPGPLRNSSVYENRATEFAFWGRENYPMSITIQVVYGIQGGQVKIFNYLLPHP